MDQNLLAQLRDYELRTFIDEFRPYLVAQTVNQHMLATCMGAPGDALSIVLSPLDNHGKNERVYDYIRGKNNWSTFLQALKESGNSHIEAFVIQEISRRGKSPGPFMGTGVSQPMVSNPNVGFLNSSHQFPNQPVGPTNMGWNQQNHVTGISSNVNPSSGWPTQVQQPAICPYPAQAQRTVAPTSIYPPSQQINSTNMMPSPYPPYSNNNLNTNIWNQVPGSTVNISPYPTNNFAPSLPTPTSQPLYPPSPLPPYQQSTNMGPRPSAPLMNNPGSRPGPFPPYYSMQ